MKKFKKIYYFNDGLDGVVIAKSLKQAVNILCRSGYHGMKQEILDDIRKSQKDPYGAYNWYVDTYRTIHCKSEMFGWCE